MILVYNSLKTNYKTEPTNVDQNPIFLMEISWINEHDTFLSQAFFALEKIPAIPLVKKPAQEYPAYYTQNVWPAFDWPFWYQNVKVAKKTLSFLCMALHDKK